MPKGALPDELRAVLDAVESGGPDEGVSRQPAYVLRAEPDGAGGWLSGDVRGGGGRLHAREDSGVLPRHGPGRRRSGTLVWEGLEEVAQERKSLRNRIRRSPREIREMKQDPARDQNFEETLQQLRREKAAMNEIVRSINERQVLNFLTDEGLLPNYAFPEAGRRAAVRHLPAKSEGGRRRAEVQDADLRVRASGGGRDPGTGAGEQLLCRGAQAGQSTR